MQRFCSRICFHGETDKLQPISVVTVPPSSAPVENLWVPVKVPVDKANELTRIIRRLTNGGIEKEFFRILPGTNALETHVSSRFRDLSLAGAGGQGVVMTAEDSHSHGRVALKALICRREKSQTLLRSYREMMIGRCLIHENICRLLCVLPSAVDRMGSMTLVFECVSTTLSERVRLGECVERPGHKEIRAWIYQLLKAIGFLHESNIIHRDIKPSNVGLITSFDSQFIAKFGDFPFNQVKLIDFGMSRPFEGSRPLTPNIGTFCYRAPELLLDNEVETVKTSRPPDVFERRPGFNKYDKSIDMWAVGAIQSELLVPREKFFRSDGVMTEGEMLRVIANTVPVEKNSMYLHYVGHENALAVLKTEEHCHSRTSISVRLSDENLPPDTDAETGDKVRNMVLQLLQWNPKKRETAANAMRHPYLKQLFEQSDIDFKHIEIDDPLSQFNRSQSKPRSLLEQDKFIETSSIC